MKKTLIYKGFTVIELMVVIMIASVMSIAAVTTYKNSRFRAKFIESVAHPVNMIKEARNAALTSKSAITNAKLVSSSYGVFIERGNNKITFFRDSDENKLLGSNDEILEEYIFPSEVRIGNLEGEKDADSSLAGAWTGSELYIIFAPVTAQTVMHTGQVSETLLESRILIRDVKNIQKRIIKINAVSGFLEIEN